MDLHFIAEWLDSAFSAFDYNILSFYHDLADSAGGVLTPLSKALTFLGEKGIALFFLAFCFALFSKTRRRGVCLFGAVCCGVLITNFILKDAVARVRPCDTLSAFKVWWETVGAPSEDHFSFPSGHVTALSSGMTALFLTAKNEKKWIWGISGAASVALMCAARNYLMAHYPSDVLFAAVIGLVSGVIAYLITRLIYYFLEKYQDTGFCRFILEFDIRWIFGGKKTEE